jgi:hypothetical protein
VLVLSLSENPDAADHRILARIPRLIAYLDKH